MPSRPSPSADPSLDVRVYEPHVAGLPPMRPYLRDLWGRRQFAFEMARTNLKAQHFDTVFGQLWTVLNPLLLALVYFFVVNIIAGGVSDFAGGSSGYLAFLVGGLFLYYFTRNAMGLGAGSIVGGGALLLNTAFPRALLPLSSTMSALLMYLPTLAVYGLFHALAGIPATWALLGVIPLIALLTVFNFGLALAAGALTVYFRDTSSFLPYLLRIWLYLSPILWQLDQAPASVRPFLLMNPLVPFLSAWHSMTLDGQLPSGRILFAAVVWAALAFLVGGWFFLSREREFAIRV
jgi:ABC-type polysaccharide/polyol phosphate export permease